MPALRAVVSRSLGAAGTTVVLLVATSLVGHAAPPDSGSWTALKGPAASTTETSQGYASWNAGASPRTMYLQTRGYALPSGMCVTTYFDWHVTAGHFDGRGARDCDASSLYAPQRWYEAPEASSVDGVQKLAVCYGANNVRGNCTYHPGASTSTPVVDWRSGRGLTCIAWVQRTSTGALTVASGGDPRRCDA